jgi:hypothetical protein
VVIRCADDYMCFVYNEITLRWVTWGPQSELSLIKPDGYFMGVDCDKSTTAAPTSTTTPAPTTTNPPTTTPPPLPTGCPNLLHTCGSYYNEVISHFRMFKAAAFRSMSCVPSLGATNALYSSGLRCSYVKRREPGFLRLCRGWRHCDMC